ncbi:MAG: IS21 family transposase [Anaerovoracaceae bacterium]
MTQKNDIRKRYYEQGKNISEISRETGFDRKTIRRYVEQTDWNIEPEAEKKMGRPRKLTPYKEQIDLWLEEDKKARRKQRHTGRRVYDRLKELYGKDFDCSYKTVCNYVSKRKKEIYKTNDCFLPLIHVAGEAQADFGEADFREKGNLHHGYSLNMSFPYSNQGYLQVFKSQNQECLFEGLISIFEHIGGVPAKIWFDNASTIVSKILKNGERILTDEFLRFCEHYGFQPVFCNPASGHEKGSVESKVGYHRRNMLVPIPEFEDIRNYNQRLLIRCDEDSQREHYHKDRQICELHEEDKKALLKLPERRFEAAKYQKVKVDPYGFFSLNEGLHEYSSLPKYAGERIQIKLTAYQVIVLDEKMQELVVHERIYGNKKHRSTKRVPYLNQLAKKPGALKYTGIYSMLPDALKEYLDRCNKTDRGKVLQVVSRITDESGFENAIRTVNEALNYGAADPDSLLMTHTRMNMPKLKLNPVEVPPSIPQMEKVVADISVYQSLLAKAGEMPC